MYTTKEPPAGRGCGDRDEGQPYACCGTSPDGMPVEHFVLDPIIVWPEEWHRGFDILSRNPDQPDGVKDLVIFVGKESYPCWWDFVEEVRLFGASRKMPPNLPFWELTAGESWMLFVHAQAMPMFDYQVNRSKPYFMCALETNEEAWPQGIDFGHHYPADGLPCAMAMQDLAYLFHPEAEPVEVHYAGPPKPGFQISLPSFDYTGVYPTWPGQKVKHTEFEWEVGAFLRLYLTHFEFKGEAPPDLKEKINQAGFDVAELEW